MKPVFWLLALAIMTTETPDPGRAIAQETRTPAPAVSPVDVLITKNSVEPLVAPYSLPLKDGRAFSVEPGVRVTQADGIYVLSTRNGAKVEIEVGAEKFALTSPVNARLTDGEWEFNGVKPKSASPIIARRRQQDDADSNLKSMQEAARKLKNRQDQTPAKLRVRWLYNENPFVQDEAFNKAAILQLSHISPIGF
jgi:hypothetical protein